MTKTVLQSGTFFRYPELVLSFQQLTPLKGPFWTVGEMDRRPGRPCKPPQHESVTTTASEDFSLGEPDLSLKYSIFAHHTDMSCSSTENMITSPRTDSMESDNSSSNTDGSPKKRKKKAWWRVNLRGFFYALVSSLAFSWSVVIVKLLKNYSPITIALWKVQGALIPALVIMAGREVKLRLLESRTRGRKERGGVKDELDTFGLPKGTSRVKTYILIVTRSILTCNALLLHFYSLKYLELGDALVISSSTPVFTYFFAHYMLGEPCGIVPILTSLTTLLGVVVIIRPPHLTGKEEFDFETLVGAGLALGCTLLATVSFVVLRYLRQVHYSITTLAFGSWGTVENVVLAFAFGVFSLPRGTQDWLLAIALACLTFFGQIAIIMALKCEQTGPVSLVRTCDVIFGFLWQIIFWHIVPDFYSLVGATIVIIGVVLTAIRKWLGSLPVNDKTRIKLWFILK